MGPAYQIVLLTARPTDFTSRIVLALRVNASQCLSDLGLDAAEVMFLDEARIEQLDPRLPAVAVYVSDTEQPPATPALRRVLELGVLVIPVVSTLATFRRLVPQELHAINGMAPSSTEDVEDVAVTALTRLLEELRLLRRTRRAFISYKRSESNACAEQLHEALERRRYEVFLDTFSVDYGVDFQSMLWDAMAQSDLVILLNTKNAFGSVWVEQEISRANVTGLGVLQLLWPEVSPGERPRGTELAEPIYLRDTDFEAPYATSPAAKLTAKALSDVVTAAERLRARAQATRRRRVVAELMDVASKHGLGVVLDKDGCARVGARPVSLGAGTELRAAAGGAASTAAHEPTTPRVGAPSAPQKEQLLLPIVAPPSAELLHDHWLRGDKGKRAAVLVYDALGILADRTAHLLWLDEHLPQKAVSVQEIDKWFKRTLL